MEYEEYRTDRDGDGLSDKWEKLNSRNPEDGLLYFEFNCGGWQTEGWESDDIRSNLAGFLGFLDFQIDKNEGSIKRRRLNLKSTDSDKALLVKLRSSKDLTVSASANGRELGSIDLKAAAAHSEITFPLSANPAWQGEINSLQLSFKNADSAHIELDFIKVQR